MNTTGNILICGGHGVAGNAIHNSLIMKGYDNIFVPNHLECDLTEQNSVDRLFAKVKPEWVFMTAAKMGSIIYRNEHPADILTQNLQMQTNVIQSAHKYNAKKLLFISSDFIYPNTESGILKEEDFFTNVPDPKDLPYSLAKTVAIKMCDFYRQQYGDNFFTVVPCAFFGEKSTFDLDRASVVAALIKRFHVAKENGAPELILWGSGKPVKEFLFSEDIGDACVFLMEKYEEGGLINIGAGDGGHTIMETAQIIKSVVGYDGQITCDLSKPDGIMRRVMDSSKIRSLGWIPKYDLKESIQKMYEYYLQIK